MNFWRGIFLAMGAAMLGSWTAQAAGTLQSEEVTRVYNKVDLLASESESAPAKVGDSVSGKTAVQTGTQSRAELVFNDQTIARLGANSLFSFDKGTRDLNLNEGVILLEVPKNAGGATVNTAAVTAAVTGTTIMIETHKAVAGKKATVKFIVLEGTMRLKLNGRLGESVLLKAGQMITLQGDLKNLPEPVFVDIGRLTRTSGLMSKQFPPLKNQPFIVQTIRHQQVLKAKGKLITLNYGLYGKKKNPVLQVVSTVTSSSSLRTDAKGAPAPEPPKQAVSRPAPKVNHPQPKPRVVPHPPVCKPPKPPRQPPAPKPPVAPAPPAVPDQPNNPRA
jgi:hypothetical protein